MTPSSWHFDKLDTWDWMILVCIAVVFCFMLLDDRTCHGVVSRDLHGHTHCSARTEP